MSNPTTAKPTTAEMLSSDPLFASIKSKVPMVATATSSHREVAGNKIGRPIRSNSTFTQNYGPSAQVNPSGLTIGGTNYGPSVVFGWGRPSLRFSTSGYVTKPSIFTLFAVLKPVFSGGNIDEVSTNIAVGSSQDGGAGGLGYTINAAGTTLTLAALRAQAMTSSGLTLTSGHWYAAAVTFDDSQTTKTVTFWLYDYTSQTLVSATGGTTISTGSTNAANGTGSDLYIAGGGIFWGTSVRMLGFLGEIADAGIYAAAFTDTLFGGYFADPWSLVRGSYTPSGSLTAGDVWPYEASPTQLVFGASRPTGGTAPYSYQWYRSTSSNFTVGSGNILSGATSLRLADTPPSSGTYWYKMTATDSAGTPATVTYNQVGLATMPKPDYGIMTIGDSITFVNPGTFSATAAMAATLYASGRRVIAHHRGVSGSSTVSWQSTGNYLPGAVTDAIADGVTNAHIMLGANDASGTITASTYQSNLQNIVTYLSSNGFTRIFVHYPLFYQQPSFGNDANNNLLSQYPAAIDALVAANPGVCYAGDRYTAQTQLLDDNQYTGPHPTSEQVTRLGMAWAQVQIAVIDATTTTAVTAYAF